MNVYVAIIKHNDVMFTHYPDACRQILYTPAKNIFLFNEQLS